MRGIPDWVRAWGSALTAGRIRSAPSDFIVIENLSVDFSDDGEHDLLCVEKTGANSQWVSERLAKHAQVSVRDVGYSGMKDRHAITRQWFSVRRPGAGGTDWGPFDAEGVEILEQRRHRRKLRRGTHKSNAFRIAVRNEGIGEIEADIAERLAQIRTGGVPNYFGEQRFGRGGANVELCRSMFAGRRLSRNKRSIALSTARSWVFNQIVDTRVRAGTWNTVLGGELANLDGSGSVFAVDEVTADVEGRCAEMDIHPTGSLWGDKAPLGAGTVAELENSIAGANSELCEGLVKARVEAASRPLRLRVQGLEWEVGDDVVWLEFALGRGGYATSVLREIVSW